ncbi:MAG: magnesium and cobalt transport protein CorA, partial [Bacteroidia bacterium]|nr:magnesium and cobalt transport protein CorA [Bacteroidia bacterium]
MNFFKPKPEIEKASQDAHLPPGTMVYVGRERIESPVISGCSFTTTELLEFQDQSIEEMISHVNNDTVTWVNIDGIHDIGLVNEISDRFNLHPLTREDIVNTTQLPKIEWYEDYLYLNLKMFSVKEDTGKIDVEQVSLVLGPKFVMSLQEKTEDVLEPVRERIRHGRGQVRKHQSDYLFYALLDV